jgi:hypothetical protein
MFSGSTNIDIYLEYEHVVMCLKVCIWGSCIDQLLLLFYKSYYSISSDRKRKFNILITGEKQLRFYGTDGYGCLREHKYTP